MFKAPDAPAAIAIHKIPKKNKKGCNWSGDLNIPMLAVKTTKLITRGFNSIKKTPNLYLFKTLLNINVNQ
jgi:hypothetical protein